MSLSLNTSLSLKLPCVRLSDLQQDSYSLSGLFQEIFASSYLQPFDRDPHLVLKDKEFEVVDSTLCRVTHGAMHASRVAAYVKVLHVFRSTLFCQEAHILKPLISTTSLNLQQLIHLTQFVGCLHDSARRAEVADRWDKESGELCLAVLQKLFSLETSSLVCLSKMIEHKDDPRGYISFLESLRCTQEQINAWNYLRELIHDADCLDIMRVRKTFDVKFLDLLCHIQHPAEQSSLIELVTQVATVIHEQGDQYKDLTILLPFSCEKLSWPKNFSIPTKISYEHAPLVYTKILEDMAQHSWLKTASQPLPMITSLPPSLVPYPQKVLGSLFENLTIFKKNQCRIFHGGPVDTTHGPKWIMPVCFINSEGKVRLAYELCFINCLPSDPALETVPIHQLSFSDLDLKTRNLDVVDVQTFFDLSASTTKAIVLRETDLLNVCYPYLYNFYLFTEKKPEDIEDILSFLKEHCNAHSTPIKVSPEAPIKKHTPALEGILERKKVFLTLRGKPFAFFVEHHLSSMDPWGSFYVFHLAEALQQQEAATISLRLDSGCNTGMIYSDARCCCQQELEEGLLGLVEDGTKDSALIHIPLHDGRGMGMAPKAETEIYKRGGAGKIHTTSPMQDVDAAQLLYATDAIDIRTYDGAIAYLREQGVKEVKLLSKSLLKKAALQKAGIGVINF